MALSLRGLAALGLCAALALAAHEGWELYRLSGRASSPQARFAAAYALDEQGKVQDALDAYRRLETGSPPQIRHDAQYNAANLYLRQALERLGRRETANAAPLLELAKESYRDALREGAEDWDVRYNLERALRLAPELEAPAANLQPPPASDRAPATVRLSPTPGGP